MIDLARTVSVDEKTYSMLLGITADLMQKANEQVSVSNTIRLATAYLKSSLMHFPRLDEEITRLISYEDASLKETNINEVTENWFDKDFLDVVFGLRPEIDPRNLYPAKTEVQEQEGEIGKLRARGIRKIYGFHKGTMYEAALTDASKVMTSDGKEYNSLSAAATSIRGYSENGWRFWKYWENDSLRSLSRLR